MKAPLFRVGQAVVCISEEYNTSEGPTPSKGTIYAVAGIYYDAPDHCLFLAEIPVDNAGDAWCFIEVNFAPVELLADEALAELLKEVFTEITA